MEPQDPISVQPLRAAIYSPQEAKVGITEFVSPGVQLPATTKFLLSDFIVNQIDAQGNLVVLKQLPGSVPQNHPLPPNYQVTADLKADMSEILGDAVTEALEMIYERLDSGEKVSWEMEMQRQFSKAERIAVHTFVRQRLTNIESTTTQGGRIKLRLNKNMRKMNPQARHKYTYFTLYKSGIDTFGAIFRLSKITGVSNKLFSTAGLKDKRGHTTQLVSVYNTDLPSLQKFYTQAHRNREIWIADFQLCKDEKLSVGNLFGNQFGLILRLVNPTDTQLIESRLKSLREIGMINYFGMQRFGQFETKTHELGAMVVRKEWQALVENLAVGDSGNFQINVLKREIFQTKQFHRAQRALPNKYKIEKMIFKGLDRQRQNYLNVFECLPRSIKTLYTHSLQSYIWNKIVSRRIKQYGLQLVPKDLVGTTISQRKERKQDVQEKVDEQEIQLQGEDIEDDEEVQLNLITEENIKQFTIHDLVAPLYGPSSRIPEESILYKYIQDELYLLNLKDQDFIQNSKFYCFKGQFRKILVRPNRVEFKIINHSGPKDQLQSPFYTHGKEPTYQNGQLRAVHLIIQLPKSSYATMAIREVLHLTSEFDVQIELNRLYQKQNGIGKNIKREETGGIAQEVSKERLNPKDESKESEVVSSKIPNQLKANQERQAKKELSQNNLLNSSISQQEDKELKQLQRQIEKQNIQDKIIAQEGQNQE